MRFVLVVLMLLGATPALAQATTAMPDPVMQRAVDGVIRPGFIDFARQSSGLVSAMEGLCAAPSPEAVTIAHDQFGETVLAYARIEMIRIGPLMEDHRAERLLFWPDRKGIALRQVQAILADKDETATDPTTLRDKSVAVQGLNALEYVLFGTDAATLGQAEGDFRCRYGLAVAGNISAIARQLAMGWYLPGGVAQHLLAPSPDNADYRTKTEATEALVGLLSHGLEAVRDTRINPFVAGEGRAANPKLALFWRSGLTLPMLRANIEGLRDLFVISGVAVPVPPAQSGLGNSIEFEFRNADRALDIITSPVEEAIADPQQAQALAYLVIVTQSLQTLIGEQLSAALDLSVGFSSLDGD